MDILNEKYEALKSFLVEQNEATYGELTENVNAVYNDSWDTFEIIGNEYKVLTDEEANKTVEDYIKDNLWAFNADFILDHSNITIIEDECEYSSAIEALEKIQETFCEDANAFIKLLIMDFNEFVEDVIIVDGRGHFISLYDGKEHEVDNFYIYHTN